MIADVIRALADLRGMLRITHDAPDGSHTVIEYASTDALPALRHGNESPTAKYLLLATPEQVAERRAKLEHESECEAARIREHGSWSGGWS